MKKLQECKEYYKDLCMDCLDEKAFEKSALESTERARYETFCEALKFIYGEGFERMQPIWVQEALNEYYSRIA